MSDKKIYGPDLYKRNEHGLLENAEYEFNEDGSVDWRAMIKSEFLYPNKGWFEARKKDVPTSPEGLDDKQLLIMLGGIKELARLRGFEGVSFETSHLSDTYVVATCEIVWSPNYESNKERIVYQDVANATLQNTGSFAAKFLETIACNRAFVRCVRNFLNIHIVGADEIDKSKDSVNSFSVEASSDEPLEKILSPNARLFQDWQGHLGGGGNFEDFKETLRSLWKQEIYQNGDAQNWNSFNDVPAKEARKIRAALKKL
jgi:hypothetical protein